MNADTTTHPIRTSQWFPRRSSWCRETAFYGLANEWRASVLQPAVTDCRAGAFVLRAVAPLWQIDALKLRLLGTMTGGSGRNKTFKKLELNGKPPQ